METIESTEASQNGIAETPKAPKDRPWIAAGFKSRDAWRASKGHKTAKKPKAAVKASAPKAKKPKKAKVVKKPKLSAKPKSKKPAKKPKPKKTLKAAAKGKVKKAERKYKPKRVEPSKLQKQLLGAFGGVGKVAELSDLGEKAFKRDVKGSTPKKVAKRFSWARNNIRWLFGNKFVAHVAPGKYKRLK